MKKHYYLDDIIEICSDSHLTVDEIYDELAKRHPKAGRSSVYRNVEDMVNQGLLVKLKGLGSKAVFESCKGAHAHFIETDTGNIKDMCLNDFQLPAELIKDFEVESIDIRVYGKSK